MLVYALRRLDWTRYVKHFHGEIERERYKLASLSWFWSVITRRCCGLPADAQWRVETRPPSHETYTCQMMKRRKMRRHGGTGLCLMNARWSHNCSSRNRPTFLLLLEIGKHKARVPFPRSKLHRPALGRTR